MSSHDSSIECSHCGESHGGMNAESERHDCMVDRDVKPGNVITAATILMDLLDAIGDEKIYHYGVREDRYREVSSEAVQRARAQLAELAAAADADSDRCISALRALLPLLDSVGFTSHGQQAAIREARACVAEGRQ